MRGRYHSRQAQMHIQRRYQQRGTALPLSKRLCFTPLRGATATRTKFPRSCPSLVHMTWPASNSSRLGGLGWASHGAVHPLQTCNSGRRDTPALLSRALALELGPPRPSLSGEPTAKPQRAHGVHQSRLRLGDSVNAEPCGTSGQRPEDPSLRGSSSTAFQR